MIHVDMEEDYLEFEGSGETMIKEMAMVVAMSLSDMVREGKLPENAIDGVVDMITGTLGFTVKGALHDCVEAMEEGEDYGEEDVQEERSNEAIRTVIKQYRKGRPS